MQTNDNTKLVPKTSFDRPILEFDFPSIQIGIAEYDEGPTGCTVFYFPNGVATAVDIRGGSPGTVGNWEFNHAICFAGGSLYGLEATYGVSSEIFARRNYSTKWHDPALVTGAVIFDYDLRDSKIYPDKALGRAALISARCGRFPLGRKGAGRSALCGWLEFEPSGQGGAFRQIGPVKLAVFTVVNCLGSILDRQGRVIKGDLERIYLFDKEELNRDYIKDQRIAQKRGNTTLSVVVTNQRIDQADLTHLTRQVHTSMARAIHPFNTQKDGDVLYAVTTNEVEDTDLDTVTLGLLASEIAWDAVISAAIHSSVP